MTSNESVACDPRFPDVERYLTAEVFRVRRGSSKPGAPGFSEPFPPEQGVLEFGNDVIFHGVSVASTRPPLSQFAVYWAR